MINAEALSTNGYAYARTERLTIIFGVLATTDTNTRGADKSLARPTSRCILFDGENISFDASHIYK
jgi:hypothetical protein